MKILMILNIILICMVVLLMYKSGMFPFTMVTKGENWQAKRYGNIYVVSIHNKAEVVNALTDFVKVTKIKAGTVSGLGAVNQATLRFFDPATKKYVDKVFNEQMEVANLTGNISEMDSKEYVHFHVVLGNDNYEALAGHLLSANINGAGEFIVERLGSSSLERTFSKEVGLNFYDFDK